MKTTTTASNPWLASQLNLDSPFRLCRLVNTCRAQLPGSNRTSKKLQSAKFDPLTVPFEHEHAHLVRSIRAGEPLNEARQVAESTLTAIMGRMSAYTGKVVQWDWVMNRSALDLMSNPPLQFGPWPTPAVAVPGETTLI